MMGSSDVTIRAVLFDFGGVLAEEGFRNGLRHMARDSGLEPDEFFEQVRDSISRSGYLTGRCSEALFWEKVRAQSGISGSDEALRQIILERFLIRDWMVDLVKRLREAQVRVVILSDQTNWLDELNEWYGFFVLFERVYNSFHLGKSKSDRTLFLDVLKDMGLVPEEALFIDDTSGHVERARSMGLHAIHYRTREQFLNEFLPFFPGISL